MITTSPARAAAGRANANISVQEGDSSAAVRWMLYSQCTLQTLAGSEQVCHPVDKQHQVLDQNSFLTRDDGIITQCLRATTWTQELACHTVVGFLPTARSRPQLPRAWHRGARWSGSTAVQCVLRCANTPMPLSFATSGLDLYANFAPAWPEVSARCEAVVRRDACGTLHACLVGTEDKWRVRAPASLAYVCLVSSSRSSSSCSFSFLLFFFVCVHMHKSTPGVMPRRIHISATSCLRRSYRRMASLHSSRG